MSKKNGPSVREIAKMYRLTDQSERALAKGDIGKAMRLSGEAAGIHRRLQESYRDNHPYSPRYR